MYMYMCNTCAVHVLYMYNNVCMKIWHFGRDFFLAMEENFELFFCSALIFKQDFNQCVFFRMRDWLEKR